MIYKNIRVEIEGGLAILTVDRPQARNALNTSTLQELESALRAAAGNSQLRVLIVPGAGEKAFVAAADLFRMPAFSPPPAGERLGPGQPEVLCLCRAALSPPPRRG